MVNILLKLSNKKAFGESSEKIAEEYGQLNLFNEAEAERQPITPEPQIEEITYKRKGLRKENRTKSTAICQLKKLSMISPRKKKSVKSVERKCPL